MHALACVSVRSLPRGIAFPIKTGAKLTAIMEDTLYKLVICSPVDYGLCVKPRGSPDKWRSNVIREQQSQTTSPDDARTALIRATASASSPEVARISCAATSSGNSNDKQPPRMTRGPRLSGLRLY